MCSRCVVHAFVRNLSSFYVVKMCWEFVRKSKCVRWLCKFLGWLCCFCPYCCFCCKRDYQNLPGNRTKTVCVIPFNTNDNLIKSLCRLLPRNLEDHNINITVIFNNVPQGNHLKWSAYCSSDREEEDILQLETQAARMDGLVVFLEKDSTRMAINNTLFVRYTKTEGHYNVQLMNCKRDKNDEFLRRLRQNNQWMYLNNKTIGSCWRHILFNSLKFFLDEIKIIILQIVEL